MKRRINEAQLRDIVRESVKRILKESIDFQHSYASDSFPMVNDEGFYDDGKGVSVNTRVGEDVLGICQRIEYLCKKEGYENPEVTAEESTDDYYMTPGQNFDGYYDNPHDSRGERHITIEINLNYTWKWNDSYNANKHTSNLANKIHKMLALSGRVLYNHIAISSEVGFIKVQFSLNGYYDENDYGNSYRHERTGIQVGDKRRDNQKWYAGSFGNDEARKRRLRNTIPFNLRDEWGLDVEES